MKCQAARPPPRRKKWPGKKPDHTKNRLRSAKLCSTMLPRRIKRAGHGGWPSPMPLCRRIDLPHSRISAPRSLYRESPLFTRGEFPGMGLCAESGCAGIFVPCTALLFAPTGIACGGRGRPPGRPFGAAVVWRENPMCRQRTARGRSGLPDGISGGLFSAVLPEKKKKFSKS